MSPHSNNNILPSTIIKSGTGTHQATATQPNLSSTTTATILTTTTTTMNNYNNEEIPVIDLRNPSIPHLLSQIHYACSTWGFFQLINHTISPQLLSEFRRVTSQFFELPYETKVKLKRNASNARGYFDDELTKRKRDWKEAYDVGVPGSRDWNSENDDDDDDNGDEGSNACLDGYNQFPNENECPEFRSVVTRYFDECAELSNRLAVVMTRALSHDGDEIMMEEEEAFLRRMKGDHTSYLRMNYYPPSSNNSGGVVGDGNDTADVTDDATANNVHNNSFSNNTCAPANPTTLGISPHRDAGFLTILLQDDDCHSLQVARFEDDDHLEDNEKWVTVHPIPGALTINTGDMAMICSNGRYRAPLHRVLTDARKKRYSAPFFYNPGYRELISPFACCCVRSSSGGGDEDNVGDDDHESNGENKGGDANQNNCNDDHDDHDDNDNMRASVKYHPCLWGYFRALRFAGDLTDLGVEIQTSHFKVGENKSNHIKKQRRFMEVVDFREPFNVEKYRSILQESED